MFRVWYQKEDFHAARMEIKTGSLDFRPYCVVQPVAEAIGIGGAT
jgi:hypothetical protein